MKRKIFALLLVLCLLAGLLSGWSAPVVYTKAEDPSVCVVELSFGVARVVSRITVTASIAL